LAGTKNITINLPNVNPEHRKIFEKVLGDEYRYMQILINFLSNAVKFSPNGLSIDVILNLKEV